jgi:hypothetical protein
LNRIRVTARGGGSLSKEDWSDVDWDYSEKNTPRLKCGYGIWVNNSDGGHLNNVTIYSCGGHGLVATRWHDTNSHIAQIHGCGGCGFKGERINGSKIDVRCESNGMYGIRLDYCSDDTRPDNWPSTEYYHPIGSPTKLWGWCENNNGGLYVQQTKLNHCKDLIAEGRLNWNPGETNS